METTHRAASTTNFHAAIARNHVIGRILDRMRWLPAPDCWLVGGCLFQTVWNVLEGRAADYGILDYDLFYFDDTDLSYDAEDVWIRRAADLFADVGGRVELRNQARVHLWYPEKFGVAYPPLTSACDGVTRFLAQACVVAVRPSPPKEPHLFAPLGLDDIFARVIRPNPLWTAAPKAPLREKGSRWCAAWPSLRVVNCD